MVVAAVSWGAVAAVVLSSAVVSGLVTALLTGRHERKQQFREQMLATASEFASDLEDAMEAVRALDPLHLGPDPSVTFDDGREKIIASKRHGGKIGVLFGPSSMTALQAVRATAGLQGALDHARYSDAAEAGLRDAHETTTVPPTIEDVDEWIEKRRKEALELREKIGEHREKYWEYWVMAQDAAGRFSEEAWVALKWPLTRDGPLWRRAFWAVRRWWRGRTFSSK